MAKSLNGSLRVQAGDRGFNFSLPTLDYNQIFNLEQTVDNNGSFAGGMQFDPTALQLNSLKDAQIIIINNPSNQPAEVQFKLHAWTNNTPDATSGYHYPTTILRPKEFIVLPNPYIISFDEATSAGNSGEYALTKAITGYSDSGVTLAEDVDGSETAITISANGGKAFQVGDIIQLGQAAATANNYREVMEIVSVDSTTQITVKRAQFGTSAGNSASTNWNAGHDNSSPIYFSYYNMSRDVGDMQNEADAEIIATDSLGYFSSKIIPLGGAAQTLRNLTNAADGLVRGSVAICFYTEGAYQELGLTGITTGTESGLTASTTYKFNITVDAGTAMADLTFVVDSSVTTFLGTNGVIEKIQDALDVQYYTTSSNLFGKKVTVSVVNGDIRFTSGSNWSTSAILLAAPDSGTTPFGVGRVSAIGNVQAAVPASVPSSVIIKDGKTTPNSAIFAYDDGFGNIYGACKGTIDYSSSAITLTGAPLDAEMQVSFNYDAALSGGNNASAIHSLRTIIFRSLNQHQNATVQIIAFN